MRYLAAAFCGVFAVSVAATPTAYANSHRVWDDTTIGDIIDDVKDIKDQVTGTGPIKKVADEFKTQLDDLVAKGFILKESVGDILTWLQSREGPYREFVGSTGTRCGAGTPCGNFRTDLIYFFGDLGALRDNFPIMERLGMGDGSRAISVIETVPPIMLFGIYQTMGRLPQWQSLPSVLQDVYDEIGDPDVFALDSIVPASVGSASLQTNSVTTFALFDKTPTQRFCENKSWAIERQIDPVRMNRLKFVVFYYRQGLGLAESLTSETIGADILGEGNETIIPNPLKAQLKVVLLVFDVVEKAVQTFQANLDICRKKNSEIEMQVAQCIPLINSVMPGTRDDIYNLVQTKIDAAEEDGLDVTLSDFWLSTADMQRMAGEYRDAFQSLCSAYGTIGSACNGACQPNNGGGGRSNP
ncbi:MAG: hypothetical protein IMF08_17795 [Proteobacteria bacterium]|nr:hypothetical protein [Pseudomonadota bacterium]